MKRQKRRNILRSTILTYVNENAKSYLIITIFLFIGIVLGIIFVNNTNESQQTSISSYINNFLNLIKNNQQLSKTEVLKSSILNNIYITLILWFLGSTIIGIPFI